MTQIVKRALRFFLTAAARAIFLIALLWSAFAIRYSDAADSPARTALAILWFVLIASLLLVPRTRRRAVFYFLIGLLLIGRHWAGMQATNGGPYPPETKTLAVPIIGERSVRVENVRDFRYRTTSDFDVRTVAREYEFAKVRTVDFGFSYWDGLKAVAHTFLSFGFENGEYLTVSVEVRKKLGEDYEMLPGFFNRYALIYVWGTEEDIIGLRTNYRREDVYLYRSVLSPAEAGRLLMDMMTRTRNLSVAPEFYNTLYRNCTTTLLDHINGVLGPKVPWYTRRLSNGLADERAYELGLIRAAGPFSEVKKAARIGDRARAGGVSPGFSARIRTHL